MIFEKQLSIFVGAHIQISVIMIYITDVRTMQVSGGDYLLKDQTKFSQSFTKKLFFRLVKIGYLDQV